MLTAAGGSRAGRAGDGRQAVFVRVLFTLFAIGWAANHFTGLLPAISSAEHLTQSTRDAIFGVYALGLVPGLVLGGRVSDRIGRFPTTCAGVLGALAGNLLMLVSLHPAVLLSGRLVVGIGVGLAVTSCTAWASDLKGAAGAATGAVALSLGFAFGPFASGFVACLGRSSIQGCFGMAAGIVTVSLLAVILAFRRADVATVTPAGGTDTPSGPRGTRSALSWAMPLAPWVFASVCLAAVSIPTHVHTSLPAPFVFGTATMLTIVAGVAIQMIARTRNWGPWTGTVGAVLAASGYAAAAAAPQTSNLWVAVTLMLLLGCAYGLCLREGLIDLESAAPPAVRGALTGMFYAVAYIGFGLPLLLTVAGPVRGSIILTAMAILAASAAVSRAIRLLRTSHRTS
ncbi:MFS transporter [Mycobacterium sp. 1100029.7]|nr:MFS transporter [Mycobacterium sp. 1100029.7]